MRISPVTLVTLALCVGRSAPAQQLQAPPGARLRLTLRAEGEARDGRVRHVVALHVETRGDSLRIVLAKGAPILVSAASVDRAWLSGGKNRLAGAGAGAFWGAGAGAVLGWVGGLVGPNRPGRPSAEELAQFTAFTSIWLGALIGVAVGRETWSPVVIAPNAERPAGTGFRFAARVAF